MSECKLVGPDRRLMDVPIDSGKQAASALKEQEDLQAQLLELQIEQAQLEKLLLLQQLEKEELLLAKMLQQQQALEMEKAEKAATDALVSREQALAPPPSSTPLVASSNPSSQAKVCDTLTVILPPIKLHVFPGPDEMETCPMMAPLPSLSTLARQRLATLLLSLRLSPQTVLTILPPLQQVRLLHQTANILLTMHHRFRCLLQGMKQIGSVGICLHGVSIIYG